MAYELVYKEETSHGLWFAGKAEEATYELTLPPEQVPGVQDMAIQIARAFREEVSKEGQMLDLKLYYDPASWYDSKWLVKVTGHGSPLPWAIIIVGVIALLVIAGVIWILKEVKDKWWIGPATIMAGAGALTLGIVLARRL